MQCPNCKRDWPDEFKGCPICLTPFVTQDQVAGDKITTGNIGPGSAVAAGQGATATVIHGNIYTGPPTTDPAEALAIYRRVLAHACSHLPLRGVDLGAADPTANQQQLGLANVYIALDTTTRVEGRQAEEEEELEEDEDDRPLSALQAVVANRRLVLLGEPGGGKTTFVNHLAHCLAAHNHNHLPDWPPAEAGLLPLLVILRDFAHGLPDPLPARANACHLWDFIAGWLRDHNLAFAADPIQHALEQGRGLLLLDGLDEVPGLPRRIFIRDAVQAFIARYPANRLLVTCRVLSYQPPAAGGIEGDPDLRLPGLPTFELAAFDEDKINRFVQAWYHELTGLGVVRNQDADGLARQLQAAVQRPDLRQLATNPLLLTVMALVHTHKGRLPDARAMLYEDTVDILLWRWEQVKAGGKAEAPRLRQLLQAANRTDVDLKRALWKLAYDAHAQAGVEDEQDKLADISEFRLEKALAALKDDDRNWAGQVIETMRLRAGLLLERAPEVFTLPHRTFQEYLAGAHLASQSGFARQAAALAAQGPAWREVILLAAGRLVYLSGDTDKPLALVGELCPVGLADDDASWRKVWLAGDVLLEIGLNRVGDSALGCDLLARVQARLAELLERGRLTPRARAAAGDGLGRLGDPRPSVTSLDGMEFCRVPAGSFRMGSEEGGKDERPMHLNKHLNYDYWIGRYPVTVAQFRAFVEASGHKPRDDRSLRGLANHPVVLVTWHDARAFCDWLTQRWLQQGRLPASWAVRLPSEAEWEKAARGGLDIPAKPLVGCDWPAAEPARLQANDKPKRGYPWGDESDPNRANYSDTGINTTSAVGCFPDGASPYGCLDMAGNIWEWMRSLWGKGGKLEFKYPYDPADGRENLEAGNDVVRMLRGGSYGSSALSARCARRNWGRPYGRDVNYGFRLVVSPTLPLCATRSPMNDANKRRNKRER